MSKRPIPIGTNQSVAKHWTLAIEPAASALSAEAPDASSMVTPGWLPRVEPELVRSSRWDSSTAPVPTLPAVDAELVRSSKEDPFTSTADSLHAIRSEKIGGSNGNSHAVEMAPSEAQAETNSNADSESFAAITDSSLPNDSVTIDSSGEEAAVLAADSSPSAQLEADNTSHPEPETSAADRLPLTDPDETKASSAEPSETTKDSLALIEPETPNAPNPQPSAVSTDSSPLATTECSALRPFEPTRESEPTNGYRHLTLSASEESRLVFQTEPNGLAAEQFRLLRRTLAREFESGAVLLITSPAMGDGKTLTSINLASCLAESGQPTLLIEADIRRPTICRVLGVDVESPGMEDILARKVEPRCAVHGIKELNLYAAMVSRIPDNPAQLIGGPGIKRLLAWARENFLWTVLDAPPILPAADVSELLPLADAALLVVRAQSTPRELAKQSVEILGKYLRGVVFNEVTVDSNPHYRYLNNYYYSQKPDSKSGGGRLIKRTKSA